MARRGAVAEWLGRGLQSLVHQFDSGRRLKTPRRSADIELMSRPALETPSGAVQEGSYELLGLPRLLRAAAAPAALVALAAGWTLLRGIDHRFISFSDGVYMYAASDAAAHGLGDLYRNLALSLPPGSLIGAALLWRLSPHIESIRIALAVVGGLTAFLTFRAARVLFGLSPVAAVVAAFLALAGPVHAQFVGLEGETLITPLALLLALALHRRRHAAAAAILAAGFLFKLTWAPFFLVGVVAVALSSGWRKALGVAAGAIAGALGAYAVAVLAFGWPLRELVTQLLLAQSHSGFQLGLAGGILLAVAVMWWPLLAVSRPGWRVAPTSTRLVVGAGACSAFFMVKQGTFFNVLDPLEPFLALLAVAGACSLLTRPRLRTRVLVAACALGAAVHVASVSTGAGRTALPLPLGAAIVDTDNEAHVNEIAAVITAHSRPDQPVLVNPLFALVAQRHEPGRAADWFILRSLERACAGDSTRARHCGDWAKAKAARTVAVVGVDSNVVSFDPSFRRDTGVAGRKALLKVDEPPLKTELYSRP